MEWWMIGGIATVMGMGAAFVALNAITKSPSVRQRTNQDGWKVECGSCKAISPAGDAGMIRIGAASKGKRTLLKCPACGRSGMMRVFQDRTHA